MRNPEDIKKFMEKPIVYDLFHVIAQDCIQCLPYEYAKEFLAKCVTADDWDVLFHRDDAEIINEIIKFLPLAYEKAKNQEVLTSIRSIHHFLAWFYCLGNDEMVSVIYYMLHNDYKFYGMPILRRIEKWLRDNGHLEGELEKHTDN